MHTIKLNIQDSVFDKVIYFLNNLPANEVEIDKGLTSGISKKSHEEIINDIKSKYV